MLGLSGVTSVSDGGDHGLALLDDGTVMAWGADYVGELGDGVLTSSDVPVPVSGLSGVKAISAGGSFSLALLEDGTVMAWGNNTAGELGDGTTESSDVPVPVSGLSGVSAISAGGGHSLALLSDGQVESWGANAWGQLGFNSGAGPTGFCEGCFSDTPRTISGLSGVAAIAAGGAHSLAMLRDGKILGWGSNNFGQVGSGRECEACGTFQPTEVTGRLTAVEQLSAGGNSSLALLENGEVMEWGGVKGDTPVAVGGLAGVTAISDGDGHAMALLGDGTIMSWTFTPAPVAGPDEVVGVSAGGSSLAYGPPAPTIVRVTPNVGPSAGGTAVTITGPSGTDFSGATAVHFGAAAASFTIGSPTSIAAVAPEGIGIADVTVTTPAGTSPLLLADRFEYLAAGPPEFGRCEKLAGVKEGKRTVYSGGYTSSRCTTVSTGKDGKYEWLPGPGPHSGFTSDGGAVTIEGSSRFTNNALTCSGQRADGAIATAKTALLTITLTGCENETRKTPCESEGAASGEIQLYPLEGVLGEFAKGSKSDAGLDLKPTALSAPTLAMFECSGGEGVLIDGSAIGQLAASDKMTSGLTLTYKHTKAPHSASHQLPESFESGPPDTLSMSLNAFEQVA
ncbi:MAG TPA: IPT/TIG domain-containing protein, partial [Solirubrobacteraceae bacterium]